MRPDRDTWAMEMANVTAHRATCLRRSVGCVLLNKRGHVLATGYNGVASGRPHCNQKEVAVPSQRRFIGQQRTVKVYDNYPFACAAAKAPSGTQLDGCEAIHAEQNALLQCRDVYEIHSAFVTASPCVTCCKLLLNTSCERIVFEEEYPQPQAKQLWTQAGREWIHRPRQAQVQVDMRVAEVAPGSVEELRNIVLGKQGDQQE